MVSVFIYGASGHAKVVIDLFERAGNVQIVGLVDDNPALKGSRLYQYEVFGPFTELLAEEFRRGNVHAVIGVGSNKARALLAERAASAGLHFVSGIHPAAVIGRGVQMGKGTVIMAGAVINPDTVIGSHVIVNTGARIDHDCVIGDGSHVAPGSILCGTVTVGKGVLIGAGAVILPNLSIGEESVVGAGATVVRSLGAREKVAGLKAMPLIELTRLYPYPGRKDS